MSNYPYVYKIEICDEYTDYKEELRCGFGFADSFTEAMEQIETDYKDSIISVKELILLEDCGCTYNMSEEMVDEIKQKEM